MQWWVSWALSLLGACGIFLTGRKKWYGFVVGIINECAWVAYSIDTKQWGFIFGATIYIAVYLFNIKMWWEESKLRRFKNRIHINIFNTRKVK